MRHEYNIATKKQQGQTNTLVKVACKKVDTEFREHAGSLHGASTERALSVLEACTKHARSINKSYTEHVCSVHRAWLELKCSMHRACT